MLSTLGIIKCCHLSIVNCLLECFIDFLSDTAKAMLLLLVFLVICVSCANCHVHTLQP